MIKQQNYFDITPDYMSWWDWMNQTTLLLGDQSLPLVDEDHWQDWARSAANTPYLAEAAVPTPDGYAAWQDWARDSITAINGVYQR